MADKSLAQVCKETADAIRAKRGSTDLIKPIDFATEIGKITTSGQTQAKTASASENEQIIRPDAGYDGLSQVTISAARLQSKTTNSNGKVTADSGFYGLKEVTIDVPSAGYDQVVFPGQSIDTSSLPYSDSYTISSSAPTVVSAENDGGVWRVEALAPGTAIVTVTESTPEGDIVRGQQSIYVVAQATLDGNAQPSDVVAGKTFYNTDSGTKVTGTMPEYNGELR